MSTQSWKYTLYIILSLIIQGCFSAASPVSIPVDQKAITTPPQVHKVADESPTPKSTVELPVADFNTQIMQAVEQAGHLSFTYVIPNNDNSIVSEGSNAIIYGREGSVSKSCPVVQYRVSDKTSVISNISGAINLWPGAILRGSSVQSRTFEEILAARNSGSLTITGLPVAKHGILVPVPSQDTVEDAMHSLLPAIDTVPQSRSILQRKEVYSLDEASYWIGATAHLPYGIGDFIGKGEATFATSKAETMVAFISYREYYTIDFRPDDGGSFFNIADQEHFERVMKQVVDNPLVYVKSVVYGRMLGGIATINQRTTDLEAALGAQFDLAATIKVGEEAGFAYDKILQEATIHLFGIGGSAMPPATISGNELLNYLRFDDKVSKLKPGAPLLYELRHVVDNSVLNIPNEIVYEKLDEYNCVEYPLPPSEITVTINDTCILVNPGSWWDYYYFHLGITVPTSNLTSPLAERVKLDKANDDPECNDVIEYKTLKRTFPLPTQNGSCFEVHGEFWDNNVGWDTEIGQFTDQYCFYNGILLFNGKAVPDKFRMEKNINNIIKLSYTVN
ncbi:MAG: thiol-activated cytolysin family protein [Caldilineaceae bacterium]